MSLHRRALHRRQAEPARRGTALALALVVVTVVAMMGVGYLRLTSALVSRQTQAVDQQRAFYLAEAGLAESFQAVRMGRTGQVGSEVAPAAYGDGLLWVDVAELEDGSVRLDSTALCGRGRSRLSLVVEPVDLSLGFFADEDLVVDSVLLVDGWDSGQSSYAQALGGQVPAPSGATWPTLAELQAYVDYITAAVGNGLLKSVLTEGTFDPYATYTGGNLAKMTVAQRVELLEWVPALQLAYPRGYDKLPPDPGYPGGEPMPASEDPSPPPTNDPVVDSGTSMTTSPSESPGPTTGSGAILGSNGSVHFAVPSTEVAEVWGDVIPGPLGSVTGLDNVSVSGSTQPRGGAVELPPVEVPIITQQAPIRHDDLLPLLISPGTSGYERIEVAPGAELVIRGPATVLVDSLILEPTSYLTLDTRAGEVVIFVTGALDLQPGSFVETTGEGPDEMTVQVSSTAGDPLNPAVRLDATSQFHGTVYAPTSDVRIGSEFEVFGGVVARRLDVAAGARLHADSSGATGSAMPRIIGWRVVEVPPAVRALRGDPFAALGVERASMLPLSEAHDLGQVHMDLTYLDTSNVERTFSGQEDQFDWSQAIEVVSVERNAERPLDDSQAGAAEPDPATAEPAPTGTRLDVEQSITDLSGATLKADMLSKAPLSSEELILLMDSQKLGGIDTKDVLLASGPVKDGPLEAILSGRSTMGRTAAVEVFVDASPLSPAMLTMVLANTGGLFGTAELQAIRNANL